MKTLYDGKTKTVILDEATGTVNLFFKDTATGENGMFDPGYNTVGGSVEGKGKIGLTISKALIEAHGGTLTATSPGPGRGAVFALRLPLSPPDSEEAAR